MMQLFYMVSGICAVHQYEPPYIISFRVLCWHKHQPHVK